MASTRVILRYKDYAALPADGKRYELHEGELSMTPAPSPKHQLVIGNLYALLRQHVKGNGLGEILLSPIDVILSDITIVQPDIVYVDQSKLSVVSARGIEGAPTLVIEILSPSTLQIDRTTKLQLYARYQVPYYWIVDPDALAIEIYELGVKDYQLVKRVAGQFAVSILPFADLTFVPDSLQP